MRSPWARSNIYILTLAGIAVAAFMALSWHAMLAGQKALGFFVAGIVLHEWEETRFPGGFFELMTRKFGIDHYTPEQAGLAHGCVTIAIVFFAFLPFVLWERVPWLAGVPVILGVFEAIIHVVGIKVHKLRRPYTPGMATALLCLLPASACIVAFAIPGIPAWQWLLAAACYLAIFAAMEVGVWRSFGVDPGSIPSKMRAMMAEAKSGR